MSRGPHSNVVAGDACCGRGLRRRVDRAVGLPVGLAREALGQELHERADRRHRIAAGRRVHEAHLDAVAGVRRAVARQRRQRLAAARVGIVEDRRRRPRRREVHRQHVGARSATASRRLESRSAGRLAGKARRSSVSNRLTIGMSSPSSHTVGVVARVAVIVIRPRRRQDEVARVHRRPLAVPRPCRRRCASSTKRMRRLRVTVAVRHLARQDQLQAGIEAAGGPRLPLAPGFSSIRTRRSASLGVSSRPASISSGRMSS